MARKSHSAIATATVALLTMGVVDISGAMAQERNLKVWFGREKFIPEDQFQAFKQDYPDINVEFEVIRLEDVNAQLILALRAGEAPDIVQIQARDVSQLALGGVVKDFTHMIEEFERRFPETYAQLSPLTWEGASDPDGKIYGAALFAQSIYLTYRKDWLEEAGIALPLETTDRCSRPRARSASCRRAASGSASA
jgi:ABC-type glycerol-3-phosphate transport system substrate-binding protein